MQKVNAGLIRHDKLGLLDTIMSLRYKANFLNTKSDTEHLLEVEFPSILREWKQELEGENCIPTYLKTV